MTSPRSIVVAMMPIDIIEAQPRANIALVEEHLRYVSSEARIIVLPELFSTGFVKDLATFELLAEPIDGETIQRLSELALKRDAAIAGSFLCRDVDGTLRNRAFFIDPHNDAKVTFYDKRHLFLLSPEHKLFSSGISLPPVVNYCGWNIALTVCFDLRFPVWCRNLDNAYDMMIVPANWPDSRFNAWKTLLTARAIENLAMFIGVNRSGVDQYGSYSYNSTLAINHRGDDVTRVHGHSILRHAEMDIDELRSFRTRFPVYECADRFDIQL